MNRYIDYLVLLVACVFTHAVFGAGAIDPRVNQENIKKALMRAAGIESTKIHDYELDHIVPLALGGHPSRPDNLQLQPWEGENGAHRKDRIEIKLQCLVCTGQVALSLAQREIAENWQAAYHRYAQVKCHRTRNVDEND